jgi:hypothetical protein
VTTPCYGMDPSMNRMAPVPVNDKRKSSSDGEFRSKRLVHPFSARSRLTGRRPCDPRHDTPAARPARPACMRDTRRRAAAAARVSGNARAVRYGRAAGRPPQVTGRKSRTGGKHSSFPPGARLLDASPRKEHCTAGLAGAVHCPPLMSTAATNSTPRGIMR